MWKLYLVMQCACCYRAGRAHIYPEYPRSGHRSLWYADSMYAKLSAKSEQLYHLHQLWSRSQVSQRTNIRCFWSLMFTEIVMKT